MRLALVSDTFARHARFGLARYAHEIRNGLVRRGHATFPVSAVSEFQGDEPEWLRATGFRRLPLSRRILATAWACGLPEPRVERWLPPVDLVHSLDVDYPVATAKPWVVTFHDFGPLTKPQFFGKARPWLLKAYVAAAVRRAAAIICVSKATADEFDALSGGKAAGRVRVIEEGVGAEFFEPPTPEATAALPPDLIDTPFFLFTGSVSPRKNLARVAAAFARVADRIPHRLVLTGLHGWDSSAELEALRSGPVRDRVVDLGYVSDDTLRALYARADGFLYPSLYEGFGLPILEAMAAGCPVVTSNFAPMTEVGGAVALFVDPLRADDVAAAMVTLAEDEPRRERCRREGVEWARRFDWDACAEATAAVYEAVLGGRTHG